MVNITLFNSECQLIGLAKNDYSALQKEMSYLDQTLDYSFHKVIKQLRRVNTQLQNKSLGGDEAALKRQRAFLSKEADELDRLRHITLVNDSRFPSGILPRVLDWLVAEGIEYTLDDKRVEPKRNSVKIQNKLPFPDLRHYQKTAVKNLLRDGRGIVVLPTGTGKTVTAAKMIWELGVKTLIITPSKNITDMMEEVMCKFFGSGSVEVLGTKSIKLKKPISIVNIQALIKIDPSVINGVDAVFIDEFHHSAATTYQEVNLKHLKNVYYRIGLTATPFRNDGADLALEGVLSEVLFEYPVKVAIEEGYLVRPTFKTEIVKMQLQTSGYQKNYREGIVENFERNELIAEIAKDERKKKVMILVQYKEHGEILKKLIPWSEFIHGEEKDADRQRMMSDFRDGDLECLIGTSVIGEGVDIPCAEVLIMAGGGKARSQVIQNIGRVLRPAAKKQEALIYDFTDEDQGYLEDHSEERHSIYENYE